MDKDTIYLDLIRLERMATCPIAMESIGAMGRVKEMVSYFFDRFLTNIKAFRKDFSRSELMVANAKYNRQLPDLFRNGSFLPLDSIIVRTPLGMRRPYLETTEALVQILSNVGAKTLTQDLDTLLALTTGKGDGDVPLYEKTRFDDAKKKLEALFYANGLSHALASSVFKAWGDVEATNAHLVAVGHTDYPTMVALPPKMRALDKATTNSVVEESKSNYMRSALLSTAYRLTIFALALDDIQRIEHSFTQALLDFLRQYDKR
jgi:hypothetical protein